MNKQITKKKNKKTRTVREEILENLIFRNLNRTGFIYCSELMIKFFVLIFCFRSQLDGKLFELLDVNFGEHYGCMNLTAS